MSQFLGKPGDLVIMKKLKLLCLLLFVNNSNVFAFNDVAVVEDRSISLDSDVATLSQNSKSSLDSFKGNYKHDYKSLPQTKFNSSDNKPWQTLAYKGKSEDTNEDTTDDSSNYKANHQEALPDNKIDNQPVRQPVSQPSIEDQPLIKEIDNYSEPLVPDNLTNDDADDSSAVLKELQNMPYSERIIRLENIVEGQKNLRLENKIRSLQDEIQALRGQLESERHKIEKAIAQQKLLYDDLDRRFSQVNPSSASNNSSGSYTSYQDNKHDQQNLYTLAYQSIRKRDYVKAIELFNKYLEEYPNGAFCANANYWLGEVYMLQSDYNKALESFDTVLNKYPKNPKAADALYKKGLVYIYQKDFAKAKDVLTKVKKQYKNTTSARLADKKLQSIENLNDDA